MRFAKSFNILNLILFSAVLIHAGFQIDIPAPAGSSAFPENIFVLPNGNIVATDPGFSSPASGVVGGGQGAVYLFHGASGQLISTLTGTSAADSIGQSVRVVAGGNFLVVSTNWNNGTGAITFCNGTTGCEGEVSAANSLIGTAGEGVGSLIVLTNGNYVVKNPTWDNGGLVNAGAVRFCNGLTGCIGATTTANSLHGTAVEDRVGEIFGISLNGNYIIGSPFWSNGNTTPNAGAVTYCDGMTGCSGPVSGSNSLISAAADVFLGEGVFGFPNGDYGIAIPHYDNGAMNTGAAKICSGQNPCVGTLNPSTMLLGTEANSQVGSVIYQLGTGGYVIISPSWGSGGITNLGAVTFCQNINSCTGTVSASNSLIGVLQNDLIGNAGIMVLANGNYIVRSISYRGDGSFQVGAVTFCSGTTGCSGEVSGANSLVGSGSNDVVGARAFTLPNGNYVVISTNWEESDATPDVGAVTFCDGTTGCAGEVSASNSLIGIAANDRIAQNGNLILPNGNFVITSDRAGAVDAGAVTFCSGTGGCPTGPISDTNSLVGENSSDRIGSVGIVSMPNGDYLVLSPEWNKPQSNPLGGPTLLSDAGAATYCSGQTGCTGLVTAGNSLTGTNSGDRVGMNAVAVGNNYAVESRNWDSPTTANVGAVTFCPGADGCTGGEISVDNSLIGVSQNDLIGNGYLRSLPNGDYIFRSMSFNSSNPAGLGGEPTGPGAFTYVDGVNGLTGEINEDNSIFGVIDGNNSDLFNFVYDPFYNQVVITRAGAGFLTIFRKTVNKPAPFDFDGDGRTDVSVFRPAEGNWYIDRSADGLLVINHGLAGDRLTPADFDGDGKTDIAVWRPGTPGMAAYYILNSNDFTIRVESFGQTGDDPLPVGDWDGDGKADPAVYRDSAAGSQSRFYYLGSDDNPGNSITFLNWGITGDKPLAGDFDGDGMRDLAVFRPADEIWYIRQSSDSAVRFERFGFDSDRRFAGDFDGDGKTDLALFRPSENNWYYRRSLDGKAFVLPFGLSTDQLVPGDYDGDGRTDFGVYRDGVWYLLESTSTGVRYEYFGLSSDLAVPGAAVGN